MVLTLDTLQAQFGSLYEPSRTFIQRILNETTLAEDVKAACLIRDQLTLNRRIVVKAASGGAKGGFGGGGRPLNIAKLDDAFFAGSAKVGEAAKCTLILTEGDSAKALAVAGLEVVGRDYFGVYPLRGKLLNAREVSSGTLKGNAELMAICSILGLQFNKSYAQM